MGKEELYKGLFEENEEFNYIKTDPIKKERSDFPEFKFFENYKIGRKIARIEIFASASKGEWFKNFIFDNLNYNLI